MNSHISICILYISFSVSSWFGIFTPTEDIIWSKDSVQLRIAEQALLFPQEKLYVHTDRSQYVTGERIWFRAYLLDAILHTSSIRDTYIYVELISPRGSIVSRVLLNRTDGVFKGHLDLNPDLIAGDYILRAYTYRHRRLTVPTEDHYGDPIFFRRISLFNTQKSSKLPSTSPYQTLDVSFYPEGGNIVLGMKNRVAFKALYSDGAPATIKGI